MLVVNMWFIKHTNGLFHYGMDYADALGGKVREIWVRNAELAHAARGRVPGANVRILTLSELLANLFQARRRNDFLFTPTSHPLALMPRQMIVMHDGFPFTGRMGTLKLALFRAGLALSGGVTAYINQADSKAFLHRCGLTDARMHYLPNRIGEPASDRTTEQLVVGQQLVVGLFGSDSPKKNYDALFTAFAVEKHSLPVTWRIYGHTNAYTDRLRADYPELNIEIASSDASTMDSFIASLDLAVSIALGEGFARPVALALMRGTPTLLLDTPVFREFYADSAQMFTTPEALVAAIAKLRPGDRLERPRLNSESALRADFERAIAWLGAR